MSLHLYLLQYVLSWHPPKDPNGVVLKYDIEIRMVSGHFLLGHGTDIYNWKQFK